MIRRNFLKLLGVIPCVTITGGMSSLLPSRIERLKEISLRIVSLPCQYYNYVSTKYYGCDDYWFHRSWLNR